MKYLLLIFFSAVSFALQVGQDVELTQYMNARYSADFRKSSKNITGTLSKGTKGTVKEVRKFASGNSGFLIEVKDGPLSAQKVWVYYNEKSPSLALVDAAAKPTENPVDAATATATRDVPVVREPATGPGVALPDADRAVADIAALNRTNMSTDCAICNDRNATRFSSSISATNDMTASFSCRYASTFRSLAGTIDIDIENNIVKKLDVRIDGCTINLSNFHQIFFNNKNIVLRSDGDCRVSIDRYNRSATGQPIINFGMAPDQHCVQFCPRVERGFWQVEMNPNSRSCY